MKKSILLLLFLFTFRMVLFSSLKVMAAEGIVLRPPFNGTYRITSFFDHKFPNYSKDGKVTIYTGESVWDCSPHCYDGHDGYDWELPSGTDIIAAADGKVVISRYEGGYGNTIIISHANNYYTMYSHLSQFFVEEEESVVAGQRIALSGSSGTNAAHLHFGVRHGGYENTSYAIDPFGWRGTGRDPLYDYNKKESTCLWAGVPGDDISCSDIGSAL
jgi:murein DD-endopeptidase MepM/ murein hydrolase activator NlpD